MHVDTSGYKKIKVEVSNCWCADVVVIVAVKFSPLTRHSNMYGYVHIISCIHRNLASCQEMYCTSATGTDATLP